MVIDFKNVKFQYSDRPLLKDITICFTDTDRIGIVGLNGIGKSTLLKLIVGIEHPEAGEIIRSGNPKLNYLPQSPEFPMDVSIFDLVKSSLNTKEKIEDYEIKSILSKLGFEDMNSITNHFSGGEKKRLALAIALICPCDYLLLDEPTNHLDQEMIIWLEKYLAKWKKGLILITHDRYFLDTVCSSILEIEDGHCYYYEGNYAKFLELKEYRQNIEEARIRKIKSILRHESEWIQRGALARSTKSKERIARYNELSSLNLKPEERHMTMDSLSTRLGGKTIILENVSKGYTTPLIENFNYIVLPTDRIGIIGDNGVGKSTLLKMMGGLVSPDEGTITIGPTVKIGYFSQHMEEINPELKVIDYIKDQGEYVETKEGIMSASNLLEMFLFDGRLQNTYVSKLSGGEKRRLQLLKILIQAPNVLLLDEPTNDLDVFTSTILENYLDTFKGAVISISHDRYFLDRTMNRIFYFHGTSIREYMGSFSEFIQSDLYEQLHKPVKVEKIVVEKTKRNKLSYNEKRELEEKNKRLEEIYSSLDTIEKELKENATFYSKTMELMSLHDSLEEEAMGLMERIEELNKKGE